MVEFYLEPDSGVPPYMQVVRQVEEAIRIGVLKAGDQLPTVKEVVSSLAINPNTVLKAYKELEHAGLARGRQGVGTFVTSMRPLSHVSATRPGLRRELEQWMEAARHSGLDERSMEALFRDCLRASAEVDTA